MARYRIEPKIYQRRPHDNGKKYIAGAHRDTHTKQEASYCSHCQKQRQITTSKPDKFTRESAANASKGQGSYYNADTGQYRNNVGDNRRTLNDQFLE